MISIITVVNKNEVFDSCLKKSLLSQIDIDYQLIVIDNTESQYSSLIDAYNYGITKATGEWLFFIHPDIVFEDNKVLSNFYDNILSSLKFNNRIGLWGIAGVKEGKNRTKVSVIRHGAKKKEVAPQFLFGSNNYECCQTVDACFFAVNHNNFLKFGFCKKLCGFHMVVEELCIRLKKEKLDIVVLPANIWHLSSGASLDYTYYRELRKVLNIHKDVEQLNTTSFHCHNNALFKLKLILFQYRNRCHHFLKGKLDRRYK